MIRIRKVYRREIPEILNEKAVWDNEFLSVSRHRLLAHYHNPNCADDDIVLLLGYQNDELLGYMGVFTDYVTLDGNHQKIGWLSTWWVHPKTKGSGIGREILNTMYETLDGKIGISQFTPSAKRVYDKSGYFTDLKQNRGIKAVLRSNLVFVMPALFPWASKLKRLWRFKDFVINLFVEPRLYFQKAVLKNKLSSIKIEYLSAPDSECMQLVKALGQHHLSQKTADFFAWMKAYPWVQEAPLLYLTNARDYEFSMYDSSFAIYMMKVVKAGKCIGFVVLQKRAKVSKLLFAYYEKKDAAIIADIVKLHAIETGVREIITYDEPMVAEFKKSFVFLYRTKKVKDSIISKSFGKTDFSDTYMNFGDGDCSFA
ncbi:GNAT family N-acetyltransferase [Flavobacterium silvaticum]|uniref:GNAT family N-acetyltransferase n=1 Tax=Flavobacterium silvaticum TaxID=1852020 RepID=A0A972JJ14_9FLAO|nr:GNAT family N-acetyltransferase [Flavobacterium silvaticum]NMH29640.1 GNAT family N-acetyltransferase [Flavobacterium silvaticum]